MIRPVPIRRLGAGLALVLLLAGCGAEPDEAAIREGLEYVHREWAEQVRQQERDRPGARPEGPITGLPRIDLAREARLDLKIAEIRKLSCRRAGEAKAGYVCTAQVKASVAGRPPVDRRIEGRFIPGWSQWVATDLRTVDVN